MYNSLYQHETEFLEDNIALSGFTPFTSKFVSSEEEYFDSDDVMTNRLLRTRSTALQSFPSHETNIPMVPAASTKQEFRRRYVPHGWPHKLVHMSLFISDFVWINFSSREKNRKVKIHGVSLIS